MSKRAANESPRKSAVSPARAAAFDILQRIETGGAYSSVLLAHHAEKLEPRDRALTHEIVLGTLRRMLHLDRIIDSRTKGKKLDPEVRIALRIGLYQMLFLERVPAHAAVNESIGLTVRAKRTSARGLVNAVLRGVARDGARIEFADEIDRIAVETSTPRWLIERWTAQFGQEEAEAIAASGLATPAAAFRRTANGRDVELPAGAVPSEYVAGCYLMPAMDAVLRGLVDRGLVYLQDEASQMTAAAVSAEGGDRLFDVCASPGSKTTQIAIAGKFRNIIAGDIHRQRVLALRENCRRQGVSGVDLVQYDAESELPFAAGAFDVILIDAPCSGTGTFRHNPEIKYRITPADISELAEKQRRILRSASKLAVAGCRMIYSTCSLESEENEAVIGDLLAKDPTWKAVPPPVPGVFHTAAGFARTFPHRDSMDGFFIAVLEKQGDGTFERP